MNIRIRSLLFAAGMLIAMFALFKVYKSARESAQAAKPFVVSTGVSDITPGTYRFQIDMYTEVSEKADSHALLFMRKRDGSLRAWFLPLHDKQPALPADDGITPADLCARFEISAEQERIECVVDDAANRRKIVHSWSWDGETQGLLTPKLRAVAGRERNGKFEFEKSTQRPSR